MEFDRDALQQKLYASALNYPDLESMVANGKLVRKSGRYHPLTKDAADALAPYSTAVLVDKNNLGWYKVSRQSSEMKKLAAKLKSAGYVSKQPQ